MFNTVVKTTIAAVIIAGSSLNAWAGGIVLDGSMGTAGALKGPDYQIKAEYGQQSGTNLFHSFNLFNILTNESATFSGPASIQNIISRVTGGEASYIDGVIRSTIEGADLLLMNPSGVLLGPNASLDISGSFHLTTADYLRLGTDTFYSIPLEGEIVSSAPPAAFGFFDSSLKQGKKETASIVFEGKEIPADEANQSVTGLTLQKDKTLSIIGGSIDMNGSYYKKHLDSHTVLDEPTGTLKAPDGQIHIISMASGGEVDMNHPDISISQGGRISMDHALLNGSGSGAGKIIIRGGEFYAKKSTIQADTKGNDSGGFIDIRANTVDLNQSNIFTDSFSSGRSGDIVLQSTESFSMTNFSKVFSDSYETGDGGSVTIETKRLTMSTGSSVASDTFGDGHGGTVTLQASESIHITGAETKVFVGTEGKGETAGDAGFLFIKTPKFFLSNDANINCDTMYGSGVGGDISIKGLDGGFAESVEVSDGGRIYSGAIDGEYQNSGSGGRIEINAKTISFINGGLIGSESDGGGRGGDVILHALETIRFEGKDEKGNSSKANASALSKEEFAGSAGTIYLKADQIFLKDGGGVTVSTEGPGDAGEIHIESSSLELDNSAVISSASNSTEYGGNAGIISILSSNSILLNNNSAITTATYGKKSSDGKKGNAGDIELTAAVVELKNNSLISSGSSSPNQGGDAGKIAIRASDSLTISGGSSITTEAEDAGKGQISIEAGNRLYVSNGKITTSIKAGGEDAGDVYANQDALILNKSKIIANAWEGRGGNIHLIANPFVQSAYSLVDASSKFGIDGTVYIETPDDDATSGLVILPTNFLDAAKWIKAPCAARTGESISRFVIKGRDAMPLTMTDMQCGGQFWFDDEKTEDKLTERLDNSSKTIW